MRRIGKLLAWTVLVALAVLYLALLTRHPRGLPARQRNQQLLSEMRRQAAELARDNERRRERIRLLREDREALELKIRERLRLRKPGTADLFYPDAPAPGPAPNR